MNFNKEEILFKVRQIFAEQLGIELEKILPESKVVDLGADSLDCVEILMALEEKFDVEADEDGTEKLETVQEFADYIFKLLSES